MGIDVRSAVSSAHAYLDAMYADDKIGQVRLEEVNLSQDDRFWYVTFSFVRPPSTEIAQELGPPPAREYKLFTIDAESGQVRGMTMRNWYEGPNPPDFGAVPFQGGAR